MKVVIPVDAIERPAEDMLRVVFASGSMHDKSNGLLLSMAISLKRIADEMERVEINGEASA